MDKIRAVFENMTSNEGTLFIYAFSYSLISSIAPFLVIIVVGTNLLDTEAIVNFLINYIPEDLVLPLVEYLKATDVTNWFVLVSLLVASSWLASKSIYSFLMISSAHDDIYIMHSLLRVLSFVYFIMMVIGIVLIALILGFLSSLRQTLTFITMFSFFVFFYRMISFKYLRIKDLYLGATVATILILLLGQLFFIYIQRFNNFQTIYGPLASIMILFISGYMISWITYLGYSVNYVFRNEANELTEKRWLTRFGKKRDYER